MPDYLMYWSTEGEDALRDRSFLLIRHAASAEEARARADVAEGVPGCWEVFVTGEALDMPMTGVEAIGNLYEEAELREERERAKDET